MVSAILDEVHRGAVTHAKTTLDHAVGHLEVAPCARLVSRMDHTGIILLVVVVVLQDYVLQLHCTTLP